MIALPDIIARVSAKLASLPPNPFITPDVLNQMCQDNILELDEVEQAARPIRRIVPLWSMEDRSSAYQNLKLKEDPRITSSNSYLLSPEEAQAQILAENKGHVFTFRDLEQEPTSMEKVAFDYLSRFRIGGKFNYVEGYKK